MSRIIKFRMYVEKWSYGEPAGWEMYYPSNFGYSVGQFGWSSYMHLDVGCIGDETNVDAESGVILSQWTGFKDMDNKDVYEGDILEFTGDNGDAKTTIVWDEDRSGFAFLGRNDVKIPLDWLFNKTDLIPVKIKVIGNIYENKN